MSIGGSFGKAVAISFPAPVELARTGESYPGLWRLANAHSIELVSAGMVADAQTVGSSCLC